MYCLSPTGIKEYDPLYYLPINNRNLTPERDPENIYEEDGNNVYHITPPWALPSEFL